MNRYEKALMLVEEKIQSLRSCTPKKEYNVNFPAEVEINKFFYNGKIVDRIMVVLRAAGCEKYKTTGGCSMCSHYCGTVASEDITTQNYINQWESVVKGTCFERPINGFSLDNYPILCLYNLGSLLNQREIPTSAVEYIFKSLNAFPKIKKVIIESRAEYVSSEILATIRSCYSGVIEVGIGVESTNSKIRELCHHKGITHISEISSAVNLLREYGFHTLAYINFKPVFLTEQEAIDDAVSSSVDCYDIGFDAISIEPTSLQAYSLANYLYELGYYRVPWLWSLECVVAGIYERMGSKSLDIRLGGYFDEEVLSGSQGCGFSSVNEIFPHKTSSNCGFCSDKYIQAIKEFNMTYDLRVLERVDHCSHCYEQWKSTCKVNDSRTIEQRIIDVLGGY